MTLKVMVFAAHPDDDIIGCGGSIAKHVMAGNRVSVCYMTSGDAGSLKYPGKRLAFIREAEARRAAKVIGTSKLFFLRNPDGYLQCDKKNLEKATSLIRKEKPDIVYVHHASDNHADHRAAYSIVSEAVGRAGSACFRQCGPKPWEARALLAYEVWTPMHDFNYSEDITGFMKKKMDALKQHKSQISNVKYDEASEGLSRYRGIMHGSGKYAEVFRIVKTSCIWHI